MTKSTWLQASSLHSASICSDHRVGQFGIYGGQYCQDIGTYSQTVTRCFQSNVSPQEYHLASRWLRIWATCMRRSDAEKLLDSVAKDLNKAQRLIAKAAKERAAIPRRRG
jgi:hypothetical protein